MNTIGIIWKFRNNYFCELGVKQTVQANVNKFQWNYDQSIKVSIQENSFGNVVCEIAAI